MMRCSIRRLVATGLFVIVSGQALAATITVDTASDGGLSCSLRKAVTTLNDAALEIGCNQSGVFGINDKIIFSVPMVEVTGPVIDVLASIEVDGSLAGSQRVTVEGHLGDTILAFKNPSTGSSIKNIVLTKARRALLVNSDNFLIEDCSLSGNGDASTSVAGVGLNASGGTGLTIRDSVFSNNIGATLGGGLRLGFNNTLIEDSIISDNSGGSGGGAYLSGSTNTYTFRRTTISNNTASVGGGVRASVTNLVIEDSTLSGNIAPASNGVDRGGAISAAGGMSVISNSTISGNFADDDGGGIYFTGVASIVNTTITNNSTNGDGGGLFNTYSDVTVSNSIISGNTAEGEGAELFFDTQPMISYSLLGNSSLTNTQAFEHNFVSSSPVWPSTNIIATSHAVSPSTVSAILAPLSNNGGATETHALVADSFAGDTAQCVKPEDQRGESRPASSACDMGAYESQSSLFDGDADGVVSGFDNCPFDENADQSDVDGDGIGDVCDDDELCFPVLAKNNNIALICL